MDFRLDDFENRAGYYKDDYGRWYQERRENADRRGKAPETVAQAASRKEARRKMDRDVLKFLHIES